MGVTADFRLGPDESFFDIERRAHMRTVILLVTIRFMGQVNSNGGMTMSENVTLFPNALQPAAAWKAYAPIVVKFWRRPPIYSGNIRTCSRERWNCLRRMGRPISNKC